MIYRSAAAPEGDAGGGSAEETTTTVIGGAEPAEETTVDEETGEPAERSEEEKARSLYGDPDKDKDDSADEGGKPDSEKDAEEKDSKAEGEGEGDDDKEKGEGDTVPDKPEDYVVALPEGYTVDDAREESFKALAHDLQLSQDNFEKLTNYALEYAGSMVQAVQDNARAVTDQWAKDVAADSDIGGDNLDTTRQNIAAVMEVHGTPELRTFLDESGVGNFPELVKIFAKVGTDYREGSYVRDGQGDKNKAPETLQEKGQAMYRKSSHN